MAPGIRAVDDETIVYARWPVGHLKECISSQGTGQTEEEDQAHHDQDFIDVAAPINHPADDRGHGRDEHAFHRRKLMCGPGLTRSSIRELHGVQPAPVLSRQEIASR
jgi:hypothetical protein